MNKHILLLLSTLLLFTLTACKDNKPQISDDNMTADLSIASVAISDDGDINEGNIQFAQGNFNTAIDFYAESMTENKALALYNIGVSYYLLGDIVKAEENFREAVATDPKFDEAIMNLVAVLAQQEKVEEAEKYISRIIYTNKSPRVYVDMANISLKLNNPSQASFYYNKALEVAPESDFVRANYANFLISIGEYLDGIEILESIDYKDFSILYNLAYAYYKLKDNSVATTLALDAFYSSGATEEGYNKLAYLFSDIGDYHSEIDVLTTLLRFDDSRDYKVRLVTAFINTYQFSQALDELAILLERYPNDVALNMLNYEVLVMADRIVDAGLFIKATYDRLKGDIPLYYYTKHLALFSDSVAPVKNLIFTNRSNSWLNLAKTVYSLSLGDYNSAKKYLESVSESAGHDYYSYKTFLAIVDRKYSEAELYSANMQPTHYETFWYSLVIAWNLKNTTELLAITKEFQDSPFIYTKTPDFSYNLIPQIADMSYTFNFDANETDIAAMMMYPIFLEPDDVVQFLVVGRSVLKDSERENATNKLEGTKRNNEALDAFYTYSFDKAISKFKEAISHLPSNTLAAFNLGVAYFNVGDNVNAIKLFQQAITLDDANPYPYFGLGLTYERIGNSDLAQTNLEKSRLLLEGAVKNAKKENLNDIRYFYMATMVSDRFQKRMEAHAIVKSEDAFVQAIDNFMVYFETKDINALNALDSSPVYRAPSVASLMKLNLDSNMVDTIQNSDNYYELAKLYVMMKNTANVDLKLNQKFANNKVYLKDMVYVSIFEENKAEGLKYLQRASDLDFTYLELYKVSLYYFVWVRDVVNAEASYGSLDRLSYEDQLTLFYKMLYFLINYDEQRLQGYLTQYIDTYKEDYRASIITALISLNIKNVPGFYSIMERVLNTDPELFNKMFIEVNFEKF